MVHPSKLDPVFRMQLSKPVVMQFWTSNFVPVGVGGATGAGGGIGAVGTGATAGTGTFLSSFRKRLLSTLSVSFSTKKPRTFPAETEEAKKADDATKATKVFLMNMMI